MNIKPTEAPKPTTSGLLNHFFSVPGLVACLTLLSVGLLIGGVFYFQVEVTADLRTIAADVHVGEDLSEVDARLGNASHGYESGSRPIQRGLLYGGAVDNLHEKVDSVVSRVFRKVIGYRPAWYGNSVSKQTHEWPVVVKYDGNEKVTAVYVDGIQITPSSKP